MKTTTATLTATGPGTGNVNACVHAPNQVGPDSQGTVSFSGAFTGPTVQVDKQMEGTSVWLPVVLTNEQTGVGAAQNPAPANSTTTSYRFQCAGAKAVRAYFTGGTALTGVVSITTGTAAEFGQQSPTLAAATATVPAQTVVAALGTVQSSTPTAAQLLGGTITQTGVTGAGTVTLPTATAIAAALPAGVAAPGNTFSTTFVNLGGGQTLTITTSTGLTLVGTVAVPSGKIATMDFVATATNTFTVYCAVSA